MFTHSLILSSLVFITCVVPVAAQSPETRRLQAAHDVAMQQLVDERFARSAQEMADAAADIARRHEADRPAPPALPSQADVKAQEFADWQRTHGPAVALQAQQWHDDLERHRAAVAPSPSAEFLDAFARHWPRTYRVRCTTRTSRSRGTYRTDTSCY